MSVKTAILRQDPVKGWILLFDGKKRFLGTLTKQETEWYTIIILKLDDKWQDLEGNRWELKYE